MQTTKPETAQQRPTGARMALLMLLYFIKIGAFTFGSGWSIIAQMEREFVDERGWMTKSDLLELIAVGKSLPGIMVANITLLFGYQMAGVLGGICAAIGLCIPAVVTLTIVTAIYDAIKDNYWVWSALKGVQCAVAPIIGGAAMFVGHIEIADKTTIGGGTAVTHSIKEPGHYATCYPLQTHKEWARNAVHVRHLSEMAKKIKQLEQQLDTLQSNKD